MSDVIGGVSGPLASQYATVAVRNDAELDIFVHGFEGMEDVCDIELLLEGPIKVVPGQTRPIGFRLNCVPPYSGRQNLDLKYYIEGEDKERSLRITTSPEVYEDRHVPHKVTYVHPSGVVSYAILRPPSSNASCGCYANDALPVLLGLHGAATNAEDFNVAHAFDPLPDLCAWLLIPQGTTPWSGDDWHTWGFADVGAAISAIPAWMERVGWDGPGVNVDKWLVSGHSNGGQGVWYIVTHRPDNVIAAASLSGYSSIQNYVPYTSWRTADPGKTLLMQASLTSYRHDLLMENAQDIPIVLQSGSKDDNVPAYHSRLMDMRIEEAGGDSAYFEVPDKGHTWPGVVTTKPLREFYRRNLDCDATQSRQTSTNLRSFSMVVPNPGDMGPKNGVKVLQLILPGQLGRIDFTYDPLTLSCVFLESNIGELTISNVYDFCESLWIDGTDLTNTISTSEIRRFINGKEGWQIWNNTTGTTSATPERQGRQLGAIDAILRTNGAFRIVRHSNDTMDMALQISRNLCQYFAADTEITDNYDDALASDSNIISISIGEDMPDAHDIAGAIKVTDKVSIRDGEHSHVYSDLGRGLAAIFLRPLPNERLELVVWGIDKESLTVVARLVPMMTGSGQPDWVVTDKTMMWKGLQGTLALGFFRQDWKVSKNAYFT